VPSLHKDDVQSFADSTELYIMAKGISWRIKIRLIGFDIRTAYRADTSERSQSPCSQLLWFASLYTCHAPASRVWQVYFQHVFWCQ